MVEDAALGQQDVPDATEYKEVMTGGQQVVQAKVHGAAKDYPLENNNIKDDENDNEDDED